MNTPDWRDILLKAASQVEQEGLWCQNDLFRDPPWMWRKVYEELGPDQATTSELMRRRIDQQIPRCAMGAIEIAAFELFDGEEGSWPPFSKAQAIEELQAEIGIWSVPVWNDQPGRTAQEVADAMRRAAARE